MRTLATLVALSLIVAACGGAGGSQTRSATARPPTAATTAGAPAATTANAGADKPVFLTTQLTDVRTGEQFAIGGFPGKVVLVIAMAVW